MKGATDPKRWTCTSHDGTNIHRLEFARTALTEEAWILVTADRHIDNPHSDWELQARHLDEARARGAAVIDVGDLFCAMGGKWDTRRAKQGVTRPEHAVANDYLDSIVRGNAEKLAPYADLFAVIARGNHETAIERAHETDLTERLCERLSTPAHKVHPGGYGGWVIVTMRIGTARATHRIKYFHGAGGGAMMSFGTLDIRRRMSWTPDADTIISGHNHNSWLVMVARERLSTGAGCFRVTRDEVRYLNCPSYKDEYADGSGGWAIERGHPPKPIGAYWLRMRMSRGTKERLPRGHPERGARVVVDISQAQ